MTPSCAAGCRSRGSGRRGSRNMLRSVRLPDDGPRSRLRRAEVGLAHDVGDCRDLLPPVAGLAARVGRAGDEQERPCAARGERLQIDQNVCRYCAFVADHGVSSRRRRARSRRSTAVVQPTRLRRVVEEPVARGRYDRGVGRRRAACRPAPAGTWSKWIVIAPCWRSCAGEVAAERRSRPGRANTGRKARPAAKSIQSVPGPEMPHVSAAARARAGAAASGRASGEQREEELLHDPALKT